jgi:hypothetical protein
MFLNVLSVTSPLLCITHFHIKELLVCVTPISLSFTLHIVGCMSNRSTLYNSFFGPRLQQKEIINYRNNFIHFLTKFLLKLWI